MAARSSQVAWRDLPGIRTFRSRRFRVGLGVTLLACVGILMFAFLARQAADPRGQFGIDIAVYQRTVRDLAAGLPLYPRSMLDGPIAAQDMLYKYPPPFAQLFWPLAWLPVGIANTIWGAIQAILAFASVWLAASFGGARVSRERILWTAVATMLFLPVWDSIWKGNVSVPQAFLAALSLGPAAASGFGAAGAILLKTTPLALAPALITAGGRRRTVGLLALGGATAVSVLLAPRDWLDFVAIQPNLLVGHYVYTSNLAPASMAAVVFPDVPLLATVIRIAMVGLGLVCIAWAALVARRPGGWPAAVTLATAAALLIPGATWYHYLSMLLPLAAFAWPAATRRQRLLLVLGAATICIGLAWIPVAAVGAAFLLATTFAIVRPSATQGTVSDGGELVHADPVV